MGKKVSDGMIPPPAFLDASHQERGALEKVRRRTFLKQVVG